MAKKQNNRNTVSVVIPTYNGANWIMEQIESIANQTYQPDEVIILDDCSSDDTCKLIDEYRQQHNLNSTWHLLKNTANLGWRLSFKNLLKSASGDIIFLCDQDDIWHTDKIAKMLSAMDAHPEVNVLASLVEEFHDDGTPVLFQDFPQIRFGQDGDFVFPKLSPALMNIMRLGCTFCVRKAFVKKVLPYWDDVRFTHDEVLWRFAAVDGSLGLLEEVFVKWRRTGTNASRAIGGRSREERIASTDTLLAFYAPMRSFLNDYPNTASETIVEAYFDWVLARLSLLNRDKWGLSLLRVLRHLGYYSRKRTFLADFACSVTKRQLGSAR